MWVRMTFLGLVALALAGCGSGLKVKERNFALSAEQQAVLSQMPPQEAIADLAARLREAETAGIEKYAPRHHTRVKDLLTEARSLHARKTAPMEVHERLQLARRHLDNGVVVIKTVKEALEPVFAQRDFLMSIGAPSRERGEFNDIVEEIGDVIELYEAGNKHKASTAIAELQAEMNRLEVRVSVARALEGAKQLMEKLEDRDFDELAPKTFVTAEKSLEDAERFISQNTRDQLGIDQAAGRALFAVRHLQQVGEQVLVLRKVSVDKLEQVVLAEEARLLEIAKALGHSDVRDRGLAAQIEALTGAIQQLQRRAQR